MTRREAIAALDALGPYAKSPAGKEIWDVEQTHIDADHILLEHVHPDVRAAYDRVVERAGDWWFV